MMLDVAAVTCPYCGETIELFIDVSAGSQVYVEDCRVCCQPIEVAVAVDPEGGCDVIVKTGDA